MPRPGNCHVPSQFRPPERWPFFKESRFLMEVRHGTMALCRVMFVSPCSLVFLLLLYLFFIILLFFFFFLASFFSTSSFFPPSPSWPPFLIFLLLFSSSWNSYSSSSSPLPSFYSYLTFSLLSLYFLILTITFSFSQRKRKSDRPLLTRSSRRVDGRYRHNNNKTTGTPTHTVLAHTVRLTAFLECDWFFSRLFATCRPHPFSYSKYCKLLCRRVTNARSDVFIAPYYRVCCN